MIKFCDVSGVVNVVTASRANTPAVGNLMCSSPKVAGVSFTGKDSCVLTLCSYIFLYVLCTYYLLYLLMYLSK